MTYGDRPATPYFYTIIGVWLAALTGLEVWLFTLDDSFGATFVPVMLLLAIAKFITVVAFYMHLRFDKNLLTLVFAAGFIIAIAVFMIMLTVEGQVAPDPQLPS
ncbi:MAG: cytochrome C oxidase subunit IV family protein [Chloroflexi bacterium]|nr:cytochrome C oxidase subunit IV family protein [Chloroflexota bacterium]